MQISTKLFDVIRMDHFIGFVKNYMVPRDATDASGGRWMKGPGRKLTDALNSVLNGTTVIADDYGGKALIPGVKKLLAKTGWLNTKVLMFAFDGDPSMNICHIIIREATQWYTRERMTTIQL